MKKISWRASNYSEKFMRVIYSSPVFEGNLEGSKSPQTSSHGYRSISPAYPKSLCSLQICNAMSQESYKILQNDFKIVEKIPPSCPFNFCNNQNKLSMGSRLFTSSNLLPHSYKQYKSPDDYTYTIVRLIINSPLSLFKSCLSTFGHFMT